MRCGWKYQDLLLSLNIHKSKPPSGGFLLSEITMIEVKDEANLVDYIISPQEILYITKKFQSSSSAGDMYQIKIMFKTSKELEVILTDTALSVLVEAMG